MFFKRVNKWWKGARKKPQGLRTLDDSDFRSNVALFAFAMKICEQQSIGEQIGGNYQDSLALASLPLLIYDRWSSGREHQNCGIHAWPLCRPKVIVTMIYSLQKNQGRSRNSSYGRADIAMLAGPDANLSLSKNLNYWPFCAHFLSYSSCDFVARWVFTEPINSLSRGLLFIFLKLGFFKAWNQWIFALLSWR